MRATIETRSPITIAAKVLLICLVVVGAAVALKHWRRGDSRVSEPARPSTEPTSAAPAAHNLR